MVPRGTLISSTRRAGQNAKPGCSMNWTSMAQGAFSQSLTMLKQTRSKATFLDSGLLSTLSKAWKDAPTIDYAILNSESEPKQEDLNRLASEYPNIRVILYEDLKGLGEENPTERVAPRPEDVACIVYTSGSSGILKGVTIEHKAVVAFIAGVTAIFGEYIHISGTIF